MIVVCDTNIFVRETHLLRKKGGPQLVRLLQVVKGQLFVPEILKIEYIEQTRLAASEERNRASAAMANFGTLVGNSGGFPLLGDEAVDQRTLERLVSLEALMLSTSMTDEVLAAAGRRSLQKKRPTSKSDHGYKDCLIWESVLRLPAGSKVRFISRDNKAFFEGDDFARDLIEEAAARGVTVVGYKDLESVLRELQASTPTLDLSPVETLEVVEREWNEGGSDPVASIPPIPIVAPQIPNPTSVATTTRAADAWNLVEDLDQKVLGYITYLGGTSKAQLFALLAQSGMPTEVVATVAGRLTIAGLVRDTGNHYLPNDTAAAEAAAAATEPEIIELLKKTP